MIKYRTFFLQRNISIYVCNSDWEPQEDDDDRWDLHLSVISNRAGCWEDIFSKSLKLRLLSEGKFRPHRWPSVLLRMVNVLNKTSSPPLSLLPHLFLGSVADAGEPGRASPPDKFLFVSVWKCSLTLEKRVLNLGQRTTRKVLIQKGSRSERSEATKELTFISGLQGCVSSGQERSFALWAL